MSYSLDDFFCDFIEPEMKKLFSSAEEVDADKFFDVMKRATTQSRNEYFISKLLSIATDPYAEDLSIGDTIKKCFEILHGYKDLEIRKLEYSDNTTVTSINYTGKYEEEELRRKLAEILAKNKLEKKTKQ
jgi:hypothetical protein